MFRLHQELDLLLSSTESPGGAAGGECCRLRAAQPVQVLVEELVYLDVM